SRQFVNDLPGPGGFGGGAAFSPDGKLLATSSYSGIVTLWDAKTLQRNDFLTNDFGACCLTFSPDSKVLGVAIGYLARADIDIARGLVFWDVTTRDKLKRLAEAGPGAVAVSFSADG